MKISFPIILLSGIQFRKQSIFKFYKHAKNDNKTYVKNTCTSYTSLSNQQIFYHCHSNQTKNYSNLVKIMLQSLSYLLHITPVNI